MGKSEFLSILRGQMTGRIPSGEVNSQIDYYNSYIDSQIAKGISEEKAIEELGDPRLIAKTLIESTNRAAEAAGYDGPYRKSTDSYDDSDGINSGEFGRSTTGDGSQFSGNDGRRTGAYSTGAGNARNGNGNNNRSSGFGCGGVLVIVGIILFIILATVISLISFSFRHMGTIIPIAAGVIVIVLLVRYLGRR